MPIEILPPLSDLWQALVQETRTARPQPASADCTLDPLKGALLDLTDPLARNPIFPGELVQGLRFVGKHARLEDCAFAC
jgi:hypothetical protein